MITFLFALAFMLLALIASALHKTYRHVPVTELKRRARAGDHLAKVLYRAAAYGTSLDLLLWIVVAASLAISFILLERLAPVWLAFIVEAVVIGVGLAWIPTAELTKIGVHLVALLTPVVVLLLEILHPPLDRIAEFIHTHRRIDVHTGLYERGDLLALFERQKQVPDSRISHDELDLLISALTFGDKAVYESMVPRRQVRMVSADDTISPVMIRDLHDSGHSRFPVFDSKPDHVVGTLYLRDLVTLRKAGQVRDVMHSDLFYVHEEYPLEQALHAFLKTKHHLFIVVNAFEEFTGIITIEDIIEQIIGCKIVDEFDAYDDLRSVAADHARHEHRAHKKDGEELPEVQESKPEPEAEDSLSESKITTSP